MNNFKHVIIFEPVGRRRPGLYANIPVPVLQVPVGEEGGPGCLQNILKENEKEEDEEENKEEGEEEEKKEEGKVVEKKDDDDDEEETGGKRRDDEEMQVSLVVEEGIKVKFHLVPVPLVSFPCNFCFMVLSAKKKLATTLYRCTKTQHRESSGAS